MGDERKRRQGRRGEEEEEEEEEAPGMVARKVKEGAEDGVPRTVVHRRDRGCKWPAEPRMERETEEELMLLAAAVAAIVAKSVACIACM
ncbi:hypothetical protein PUN28_015408 [Cardiocondyla obscurior]|uniref:Uncharacterized protein n=1 Tax=Cardiocondyla obscurior TaxID=286306 RepID=A0AAW2EY40_9HYME